MSYTPPVFAGSVKNKIALAVIVLFLALPAWSQGGRPAPPVTPGPPAGKFELLQDKIDLGSHEQGETVTASVKFTAPRSQVDTVRVTGFPGLQMHTLEWQDNSSGTIHFAINTSLLTENVTKSVTFEPVRSSLAPTNTVGPDTATLSIQIKGKVGITQLPQTETAKRENMVELEIRNVGSASLKIETVRSMEPTVNFSGEEDILPVLAPGESVVLPVYFTSVTASKDPELAFRFGAGVFPKNALYYRLDPSKFQLTDKAR